MLVSTNHAILRAKARLTDKEPISRLLVRYFL
jgi:hypothetical protein